MLDDAVADGCHDAVIDPVVIVGEIVVGMPVHDRERPTSLGIVKIDDGRSCHPSFYRALVMNGHSFGALLNWPPNSTVCILRPVQ
jgi:hypothetical protein